MSPNPVEESVIHDDLKLSLNGHVGGGDTVTAEAPYISKEDTVTIGPNETSLLDESSSEEEKVPQSDFGRSFAKGIPKRYWVALACFALIACAVAATAGFLVKGHQPENTASAQVTSPQLEDLATFAPTVSLAASPSIDTTHPTKSPTKTPLIPPTKSPQMPPTTSPVVSSTQSPSSAATELDTSAAPSAVVKETYIPGNLTRQEAGLLLSEGLLTRIIATSGEPVQYQDGTFSTITYHGSPDFGATFPDTRPFNEGGWVYASNSEMEEAGKGGVGALTFNSEGNIIDYRMVLVNTTMNCGGGKTPW